MFHPLFYVNRGDYEVTLMQNLGGAVKNAYNNGCNTLTRSGQQAGTNFIVFDEISKTGISIIDDQHKSIIALVNMLHHNSRSGYEWGIPYTVILALRHSLGMHYETERWVLDFSSPEYVDLYEMHYQDIFRRLVKAESLFRQNMLPEGALVYLKGWLGQHMEIHEEFFLPGHSGYIRPH